MPHVTFTLDGNKITAPFGVMPFEGSIYANRAGTRFITEQDLVGAGH